ncbi:small nuclear ribonucleoprotein-associated protein B [Caerostris extrusa]|uniref:Sm protein B n=1 Tax=Caerostris extrusa TaxID=172846 RepID=A0AAV4TYT3_CAEEX|nr:small nuclear ribonucleoprotein-associated protein B [Caerostris extrusa]
MTVGRSNQILQFINHRMRIILRDSRTFIGTLSAYDHHMNLVLTDCTEYRKYKPHRKAEIEGKKVIGTAIFRGENITSIILENPPKSSSRSESESGSRYGGGNSYSRR